MAPWFARANVIEIAAPKAQRSRIVLPSSEKERAQ